MKQYKVDVAGISHTFQLSAEDAKRLGAEDVEQVETKQAAPRTKQATPKNKADATSRDA